MGEDFFVPTERGAFAGSFAGSFEYTEKKSRFIGRIWQISSEEEAKERILSMRKEYHDARHHCWCYRIDQNIMRYSDDGEPQGTAGQPMLNVFIQEKIQQVCCVVTRYFGGVLLGTGGLVRAYSHTAKGALEDCGLSVYLWLEEVEIITDYPLLEGVLRVVSRWEATVSTTDYGSDVTLRVWVPEEKCLLFLTALTEATAGQVLAERLGQVSKLVPWQKV